MTDTRSPNRLLDFFLDIFFLSLITAFSYFLISFYKDANFIKTGYADWIVHGFRIKSLDQIGFTSWNHMWANGANIWKSYQFIPHIITLGFVKLLGVKYLRAMVIVTIVFFCFFHVEMYFVSRWLDANPFVAFIAAIISVTINQFWGNINDFSMFVGVVFAPLFLFAWIHYQQNNLKLIFPFLIGLSFYIHPILGFYISMLWVMTLVFDKKIFSIKTFLEIVIFACGSSLFWMPLVIKDGYAYTDTGLFSLDFFAQQLVTYAWFGTSLSITVLYIVNWMQIFFDDKVFPRWSKLLLVYVLIMSFFILLGTHYALPSFLYLFQHTRGMDILGIIVILSSVPLLNKVAVSKQFLFKGFLFVILSYAFIESIWISSTYSAGPGKLLEDPLQTYVQTHKNSDILTSRFWAGQIDTTSYFAPQTARISYDYIGHLEPNMIPPRLISLIYFQPYGDVVPPIAMTRVGDYFKLTGTKYMFFDETSVFTKSLLDPDYAYGYKNLGQIALTDSLWHAFRVPWTPIEAGLLTDEQVRHLSLFPQKLNFSDPADQLTMDQLTHSMAKVIYSKDTMPITPAYPGPEDISLYIPPGNVTRNVYIDESYSNSWVATINNQLAKVNPIGPYYMLITLPAGYTQGTLYMHHDWPLSYHIAVFSLAGGVLIIIVEFLFTRILYSIRNRKTPLRETK